MILGIDLGTTFSLGSIIREGKPVLVDFDGSSLLPSVVGFAPDGNLLVGRPAKNQYYLHPENTVKSIKRKMGTTEKTVLSGKEYLPEEISSIILRHIKETAEKQFGMAFKEAVITVPAYFSDDQRKATQIAGAIAGFDVKRIINEPTAAALVYNSDNSGKTRALVYDLGGGTFDVSIVDIADSVVEVLSSHGNNHLGGDDFDEALSGYVLGKIHENSGQDLRGSRRACAQILMACEKAKIELSDNPFAKIIEAIPLDADKQPLNIDIEISRTEFEELIHPYIRETMDSIQIALNGARLNFSQIDQIILVGGSSRIPLVQQHLEALFKMEPMKNIHPDLSVCIGAAIQGAILENSAVDSILVDVTPYTFGHAVVKDDGYDFERDVFAPLIRKNTPIPVSKSEVYSKMHPDQERIEVTIYQGEDPTASNNKLIGSFQVDNLAKGEDNMEIIISMNLDLNGILTVSAQEKKTGLKKHITIHNSFSHDDISQSKSKINALFGLDGNFGDNVIDVFPESETRKEDKNHAVFVANTIIEKARTKMAGAGEENRRDMERIIGLLSESIQKNDPEGIKKYQDELTDILFFI